MWNTRKEAKKLKWNENKPKNCLTKKKSEAKTNGNKQNNAKIEAKRKRTAKLLAQEKIWIENEQENSKNEAKKSKRNEKKPKN